MSAPQLTCTASLNCSAFPFASSQRMEGREADDQSSGVESGRGRTIQARSRPSSTALKLGWRAGARSPTLQLYQSLQTISTCLSFSVKTKGPLCPSASLRGTKLRNNQNQQNTICIWLSYLNQTSCSWRKGRKFHITLLSTT
jgi:hypothetical protein